MLPEMSCAVFIDAAAPVVVRLTAPVVLIAESKLIPVSHVTDRPL